MLNNFVNVFHFKIMIFIDAGQRNDFLVPWFNYWVSDDYTSTKVSCCWWTPTFGKYVAWNLFKGTQLSELNFLFMLKVANIRCFNTSIEHWASQHWIISWMEENQTATYFLCSRLFTYDIMKNFNCNISLCFFKSKFRSYIGKH